MVFSTNPVFVHDRIEILESPCFLLGSAVHCVPQRSILQQLPRMPTSSRSRTAVGELTLADRAFALLKADPYHPSLRFRAQSTVAVAALLPNPFDLDQ